MKVVSTVFDVVMIPLQLLIVFFTIYYFVLSFFGLYYRKKEVKIYEEKKTFALIVCAHNEAKEFNFCSKEPTLLTVSIQSKLT